MRADFRLRFIPAGAGNTSNRAIMRALFSVYPRWRGEHAVVISCNKNETGLSPLARGTRIVSNVGAKSLRFIPAGAGNTDGWRGVCTSGAVYPRWRGEHATIKKFSVLLYGLSPLARGTQFPVGTQCGHQRFIPAGAGNTR